MHRDIKYIEEDDLVLLRTEGSYLLDAEIDTLKQLAAQLKRYDCHRLLIDHRKTDVVVKVLDAYHRPEVYEEVWGDPATVRAIRSAIVFREITEDYRFLENVIRNRGWNLCIFDDYDSARQWLLK